VFQLVPVAGRKGLCALLLPLLFLVACADNNQGVLDVPLPEEAAPDVAVPSDARLDAGPGPTFDVPSRVDRAAVSPDALRPDVGPDVGPDARPDAGPVTCDPGYAACEGYCVNLASDWAHCGACGRRCPEVAVCTNGLCAERCDPRRLDCQGSCVDPQTDPRHCGQCLGACAPGQRCVAGQCTAPDPCANVFCPVGQRCAAGLCLCPDNVAPCNGVCCGAGLSCEGGQCACPRDRAGAPVQNNQRCNGVCTDLMNDTQNCSQCGLRCPPGLVCQANGCRCPNGGEACGNTCCTAGQSCNAGVCGSPGPTGRGCRDASCPVGEVCGPDGRCVTTCPPGSQAVRGVCVYPATRCAALSGWNGLSALPGCFNCGRAGQQTINFGPDDWADCSPCAGGGFVVCDMASGCRQDNSQPGDNVYGPCYWIPGF